MRYICFYFQVHQPYRLRKYRFFDIGQRHDYYDDFQNKYILQRVSTKCYLPMNQLLLELIHRYGERFKVSFSISGVALEQFRDYVPEVIESFRKLAETGCVEFLAETYSHSLAVLKDEEEFAFQVQKQQQLLYELIGYKSTAFRNTELIYSDHIGEVVYNLGYDIMLTEGAKHILGWRSPNYLYYNALNPRLRLLLKNFRLSDDIAFRFSNRAWDQWPLTAEKYVHWLNQIDKREEVVNLFMDYETFGEHQWPETGIFDFMRALPHFVFANSDFVFATPTEVANNLQPVSAIHVPYPISWADEERDLTAWLGNDLQDDAFNSLYSFAPEMKKIRQTFNEYSSYLEPSSPILAHEEWKQLQQDWLRLQTSDHFYYMCTKWFADGDVHKYFNPYGSPYDAYINYMNVLSDLALRIARFEFIKHAGEIKTNDQVIEERILEKSSDFTRKTRKTPGRKAKENNKSTTAKRGGKKKELHPEQDKVSATVSSTKKSSSKANKTKKIKASSTAKKAEPQKPEKLASDNKTTGKKRRGRPKKS